MQAIHDKIIELSNDEWISIIKSDMAKFGVRKSHGEGFESFTEFKKSLPADIKGKYLGRTLLSTLRNILPLVLEYLKENNISPSPLFHALLKIIPVLLNSPDSQITYFSKIRNIVRQLWGSDSKEYEASRKEMFTEQTKIRNKEYREKVAEKAGDQFIIPEDKYVEMFKLAYEETKSLPDLIITAIMASGSRFIEVVKLANYEKDPSNKQWVVQTGVAKALDGDVLQISKPILFIKASRFIGLIKRIRDRVRDRIKDKTNEEIASLFVGRVNSRLADLAEAVGITREKVTSHILRAAYGSMAYDSYGRDNETLQHFLSRILGHKEGTLESALSYSNTKVSDLAEDKKQIGGSQHEAELLAQIRELKEALSRQMAPVRDSLSQYRQDDRFDKIHRVCKEMRDKGERITYTKVRARTGIGMTSVSRYMESMRNMGLSPGEN